MIDVCVDKENLCLYGHPNESWEVTLPAEEVPPELPEPALGINFSRDGMQRRDWLSLVAVHSDSWLLSVAFYQGARLNRNERYTFGIVLLILCLCLFIASIFNVWIVIDLRFICSVFFCVYVSYAYLKRKKKTYFDFQL